MQPFHVYNFLQPLIISSLLGPYSFQHIPFKYSSCSKKLAVNEYVYLD